jgi:hypothetical protein
VAGLTGGGPAFAATSPVYRESSSDATGCAPPSPSSTPRRRCSRTPPPGSRAPALRFATAALNRRAIGKYMGSLACKAGLWWAKEVGEPVYYVMDGISIDDAIDYKVFKSAQINAIMASAKANNYLEVITFASCGRSSRTGTTSATSSSSSARAPSCPATPSSPRSRAGSIG